MAQQYTRGPDSTEPVTGGPPGRAEPSEGAGVPAGGERSAGERARVRVPVRLPGVLRELAAGSGEVRVEVPAGCDVAEVFDAMRREFPALERRIRDERGELRPHVNVFVGDTNVRDLAQQATKVPAGAELQVIPAVSGG